MSDENFIDKYLTFRGGTEVPTIFNRWSCIAGISALLGRQCYVTHGHNKIYPNQYIMLVGDSGARKDAAIKPMRKLLNDCGYKTFCPAKTTKEKLLQDMEEGLECIGDPKAMMDINKGLDRTNNPTMKALFPELELSDDAKECFVVAGEFNSFIGHGNIDFIAFLTEMWDYDGIYDSRIKTGRSVRVPFPTFNILGGNTNTGLSQAFPTDVIGQGLFSRLLLIYSDPTGKRITFPPPMDIEKYTFLRNELIELKKNLKGEILISPGGTKALDEVYQTYKELEDERFKSYSTRRFIHLLKLSIIYTAASKTNIITEKEVTLANSTLHYTEHFMPKALGEFGKARNSDSAGRVLQIIENSEDPVPLQVLWKQVRRDLDNAAQLTTILRGLQGADKIQVVNGNFLPLKKPANFNLPFCQMMLLQEYREEQIKKGILP